MLKQFNKKNQLLSIMNNSVVKLPTPPNISYMWSFGSMLGLILIMQLVTGLLWASTYSPSMQSSFMSTFILMQTLDKMWLIRYIHLNGASMFFLIMYLHMFRGLFYNSFNHKHTWMVGVSILLLSMATAFVGYVLPMNQMSFWAASVITNIFSEIPYIGKDIVNTIWGGPSVNNPTITRFYMAHFLLPFVILMLSALHLLFLHNHMSSNPLGFKNLTKNPFHPLLSTKDMMGFLVMLYIIMMIILLNPLISSDAENFINANPSSTPLHIQPEWYFLFAYTILRSIPNKMGGVIALLTSVLILYTMPFTYNNMMKSKNNYPMNKMITWFFILNTVILTWGGTKPVEDPFILTSMIFTSTYFLFFIINPLLMKLNDKIIFIKKKK